VSSDQLTYVLVALVVTGVAILLLLIGALVARRGRNGATEPEPASRGALVAAPPATPAQDRGPAPVPFPATQPMATAALPQPISAAAAPAFAPMPAAPQPIVASLPAPMPAAPQPMPADATAGPSAAVATADGIHEAEHAADDQGVTAADLEAAARRVHDPREQDVIEEFLSITPRRRDAAAFDAPRQPTATAPGEVTAAEVVTVEEDGELPDPYVDPATGLDSRAAWDRALDEENARFVRYRRPVGVVICEIDGLARFEREFGPEAGRRILVAVGETVRRSARRTDRVAHAGGGRFLVLLPETDEVQAINYVERVRSECERWLAAGALALHVSMGWASPSAVGELDTALRTAEERMYAERRRAARAGVGDSGA
jgi:diguanylate cyclase (GGDEF)-like protein